LDELYLQPAIVKLESDMGVSGITGDVAPLPLPPLPVDNANVCSPYQMVREAIEMHKLRMQYDLEINRQIRQTIRDMKQDIFSEQKQIMELFRVEISALKDLGVNVGG
jgi:hypothetical protein